MKQGLKLSFSIGMFLVSLFAASAVGANAQSSNGQTQAERFGAIAYSPSTRRFGSSWNQRDQAAADDAALRMCNRGDCQILVPLANSCGALAVARSGAYAWGDGGSLYDAKLNASNRCTRDNGSCKLICSVCSGGNTP